MAVHDQQDFILSVSVDYGHRNVEAVAIVDHGIWRRRSINQGGISLGVDRSFDLHIPDQNVAGRNSDCMKRVDQGKKSQRKQRQRRVVSSEAKISRKLDLDWLVRFAVDVDFLLV